MLPVSVSTVPPLRSPFLGDTIFEVTNNAPEATSRFEKLYEEMKKIDGFPLRTELDSKIMGMKLESVSEATEVRKGPIPPGTFDPPAGYKKKDSPYEKKK